MGLVRITKCLTLDGPVDKHEFLLGVEDNLKAVHLAGFPSIMGIRTPFLRNEHRQCYCVAEHETGIYPYRSVAVRAV